MPISVRTAATRLTVSKASVLSGSLRPLRAVKVMAGSQIRTVAVFAGPFSVSAQPDYVSGYAYSTRPTRVSSDQTTAVVSGGFGPYRYAWSVDDGGMTVTSPSNATTTFSAFMPTGSRIGTATCIVTDAYGSTAVCQVTVELTNDGGFQ